METQQILDMFLKSGQELVEKGTAIAEEKLNLPEDPEQRKALLDGASKGAIAASALALLLGTSAGRKLTGASLKLGSLAAIGSVAFKAFQTWQSQQAPGSSVLPEAAAANTAPEATDARSKALLKAMIAAAKADGHIDDKERDLITQQIAKLSLGDTAKDLISEELTKPLDVNDIAAGATSPESAAEIYLTSRMILDLDNDQERIYLDQLAKALALAPELIAQLDSHAASA